MGCVVLAIYIDDILLTGSDVIDTEAIKIFIYQHFVTSDLSPPRYFVGSEFFFFEMREKGTP